MRDLPLFASLAAPTAVAPVASSAPLGDSQLVGAKVLSALRAATIAHNERETTVGLPPIAVEVYAKTKQLLANYGFVWKSTRGTHIGTPADWVGLKAVIETGLYFDSKRELEFFATSDEGATMLVDLLVRDVWSARPRILEPSAGDGVLVAAVLAAIPEATVTAVELDPMRVRTLRARFSGDDRVRIVEGDILDLQENGYDAVIMNPPFALAHAHVRAAVEMARRYAPIVGIALLARRQDRELAQWLHEADADSELTNRGAFRDTTVQASYFWMRAGSSYLGELRSALDAYPRVSGSDIQRLCAISRDLHKTFEDTCNGDIEADAYDAILDALLGEARSIVERDGITIVPAWDPRAGHGMRLALPSGRINDFGKTGMIVPNALPSLDVTRRNSLSLRRRHA